MSKLSELTDKLGEILQIDRRDLDFGVYRILNTRADDKVAAFLGTTLSKQVQEVLKDNPEQQNALYNNLLIFFGRYYDNGDFISQRRYKGDTYTIPYGGEEVMLHWANKD